MPSDPGLDALMTKIDHIIVLMLENRSFDHMLGYLRLNGRQDVDGLQPHFANTHNGRSYPIRHLDINDAADRDPDPCHEGECVDRQMSNNNGGFVADYVAHHSGDPSYVMGFYDHKDLPIYDYLARNVCICDRWFSSVPGTTWPNRLYAVTGGAQGSKNNEILPLYHRPSFVRYLPDDRKVWRWYSHDLATLRIIDPAYRSWHFEHFYHFDPTRIPRYRMETMQGAPTFLSHVASGDLAAVSWIDPDFTGALGDTTKANDDHPPCDVRAGQNLVRMVCDAVINGPKWERTLLIIVYDEHGGFYDHVPPPPAPDDDPRFTRYGVRVPVFLVSPWVIPGQVSHVLFDHTSIIKTILLRFGQNSFSAIMNMGARVANANHLGSALIAPFPRSRQSLLPLPPAPSLPWDPRRFLPPTAFQQSVQRLKDELKESGVDDWHP
ncbi:MAG: hypothetical protein HYZ50_24290 [Deltaproteobacteria bacterium]|nr:hypothetical protein [Deltaproteobacteria bacterium]